MSPQVRSIFSLALFALLCLSAVACGPSTPEGKIAEVRAGYKVELNTWQEVTPPAAEETADESGAIAGEGEASSAAVAAAADEATAEGEEGTTEEIAMEPMTKDVLFDLIIYFRGKKSLAGLTVDVTHADSAQQEKGIHRHYIETAGMVNGDTRQTDFVLEGLEVEEGDAFAVTVAQGIPEDLSAYREFSEPAP